MRVLLIIAVMYDIGILWGIIRAFCWEPLVNTACFENLKIMGLLVMQIG
ncbi:MULTISPECIES: hypothetical protein [unclassified Bartonella]